MTKKPLVVFLLTCVLVLPLFGWLYSVHGIGLADMSVGKIRAALAADSFLRLALIVNSVIYMIAFAKVMLAPPAFSRTAEAEKSAAEIVHDGLVFRSPAGGYDRINPSDKKWQVLYNDKNTGVEFAVSVPVAPSLDAPNPVAQAPEPQPSAANVNVANVPQIPDNVVSLAEEAAKKMYRAKVEAFLAERGYYSFGEAVVAGVALDFVSIANDDVLAIGIVDPTFGSISANDVFDMDSSASWYSPAKKYPSPVWAVATAVKAVKEMMEKTLPPDNGVEVHGFVVVPNANVSNADAARDTWISLGVEVVKFDGYQENLDDFEDVLPVRADTEPLLQYREFIETMLSYFSDLERAMNMKKAV